MDITKIDPVKEMEKIMDDDFLGFFPAVRRFVAPAMDVYETEKELVVELQTPNIDPSKINVCVEDGVLKIEGGVENVKEKEGRNYYKKEIRSGQFARSLILPVGVKEDEVKAKYENGMLKITMPKSEIKKPKKIEVEINR
jgi:HSP20 family protein